MKKKLLFITAILLFVTVAATAREDIKSLEWPQFRGPNGSGISRTTGLPHEFGPDKNVIWKLSLPTGYSSPVLAGNFIFVTACDGETLLTICLNRRNGEIIWEKKAPRPRQEKIDNRNNPASPSPVTDGKQVLPQGSVVT